MNSSELAALIAHTHSNTPLSFRGRVPPSQLPAASSYARPRRAKSGQHMRSVPEDVTALPSVEEEPSPQRTPILKTRHHRPPLEYRDPAFVNRPSKSPTRSTRSTRSQNHRSQAPLDRPSKSPARSTHSQRQKNQLALKPFQPLPVSDQSPERPKTSRGLQQRRDEAKKARSPPGRSKAERFESSDLLASVADSQQDEIGTSPTRTSKFGEGSMSGRSGPVASTWYDHSSVTDDEREPLNSTENINIDTDSDTTPKASKSAYFDSCRNLSPSRRSIFRFGGHSRSSQDTLRSTDEGSKRPGRSLRKSLSTWNFQGLGEKIRMFGSASDVYPDNRASSSGTGGNETDILNERKRKAEHAYANHLGPKKRKSLRNLRGKTEEVSSVVTGVRNTDRIPSSGHRPRTPKSPHSPAKRLLLPTKKVSRSELIEENRRLRALLEERTDPNVSRFASKSSAHLPLDVPDTRFSHENFMNGHVIILPPGQYRGGDVPPVPKVPERQALRELENRKVKGGGKNVMVANEPKSAKISVIEEEVETDEDETLMYDENSSARRVRWEWPEDVF